MYKYVLTVRNKTCLLSIYFSLKIVILVHTISYWYSSNFNNVLCLILQVTFETVGGLGKHVQKLKEMIVFPLLYPEVFERFKIQPPRGCLFYGPPGTGKTLVARALANECSHGDKKVAFFMRKGADCLSKWVGESERQLRLLFDQVCDCIFIEKNVISDLEN